MQRGSVRSSLALGTIAVLFLLSMGMNAPRALRLSHMRSASIQDREPQFPIEKRLRSLVRRFITTILGEWDTPHP